MTNASHPSPLDEEAWFKLCEKASDDANRVCGQSYEWYITRFSEMIEEEALTLPVHQLARALAIAAAEWDYITPEERSAAQAEGARHGYCMHGIPVDCCPAGCGEV